MPSSGYAMKKHILLLCLVAAFSLCCTTDAHAYIDPGIGSLLLQGLAAALVTLMLFWRGLRERIRDFFVRKPSAPVEKDRE